MMSAWPSRLAVFLLLLGCTAEPWTEEGHREEIHKEQSQGALSHEAFVWQREWTASTVEAVRGSEALDLDGLIVLGAEISHRDDGPRVVRVPVDFGALVPRPDSSHGSRPDAGSTPMGLALRIGGLSREPYPAELIADVARRLVAEAEAAGISPGELQVDHDCPTRRLEECAELLREIRREIAPTPLTFTALPSWLDAEAGFQSLLGASDGYVLQVHSLDRPGELGPDGKPAPLCQPQRARDAVLKAARFGRAFRVALPTHSYVVTVDERGKAIGVDAEDADLGRRGHVVSSDPAAMADLVQEWTAARPKELEGLLWFRLPVAGDRFNWTGETLATVIAGERPESRLVLSVRQSNGGLAEVEIVNRGEISENAPPRIELEWDGALAAGDGLGGYRLRATHDNHGSLVSMNTKSLLKPGETRPVAWLRFQETDTMVTIGAHFAP